MSKNAKRLFDYLQENEPEPQIFGDFDDFGKILVRFW